MFHVSSSQPRWCEEEDWFTQKLLTIRVAAPKQPSALEQVSEEDIGTGVAVSDFPRAQTSPWTTAHAHRQRH